MFPVFRDTDARVTASQAGAAVGSAREAQTVFIELGESAQRPLISRDGALVPIIRSIPDKIADIIRGGEDVVVKVLSQSVRAGTNVPKGTTIDLMLSSPFNVPLDVFDGVHIGLASQSVGEVHTRFVKEDPQVRNVLARNDTFEKLNETDRSVIVRAAQAKGLSISDQAGNTLANLYTTLQAASTFGG